MNAQTLPIVSVVMPMFNAETTVEMALRNVLTQTFTHFEVIVIDDGSSDTTVDKVSAFNDPRIQLITQQRRGLAGARNTGINAAKGKYIALLDATDVWAPNKLQKHVDFLMANPKVGVSYSATQFVNEDGIDMGMGHYPTAGIVSAGQVFCCNPIGNTSAPVIRKETLDEVAVVTTEHGEYRKVYFDEGLTMFSDLDLWLRIALNCRWKIAGIDSALTFKRIYGGEQTIDVESLYRAWKTSVTKQRRKHAPFFNRWYRLAKAYQLKHLARQAVRCYDGCNAMKLIFRALASHPSIVLREPARTLISISCAVLALFPKGVYDTVESLLLPLFAKPVK